MEENPKGFLKGFEWKKRMRKHREIEKIFCEGYLLKRKCRNNF